jgi:hypothetical protein
MQNYVIWLLAQAYQRNDLLILVILGFADIDFSHQFNKVEYLLLHPLCMMFETSPTYYLPRFQEYRHLPLSIVFTSNF